MRAPFSRRRWLVSSWCLANAMSAALQTIGAGLDQSRRRSFSRRVLRARRPLRRNRLQFMRMLHTRVSTHCLRWLSEGAQEGATHTIAVGETRLPSDDVDRMTALLHH